MCCVPLERRCQLVRTLALASLVGMLTTRGLWLPAKMTGRTFPRTAFLPLPLASANWLQLADPLDSAVLTGQWMGLVGLLLLPALLARQLAHGTASEQRRAQVMLHNKTCSLSLLVAICYGIGCLSDASRAQTWMFQYALMLTALAVSPLCDGMAACRLVLGSCYLWSGLLKLNPEFFSTESSGHWMSDFIFITRPFTGDLRNWMPASMIKLCCLGAALGESTVFLLLLCSRTARGRRLGVMASVAMHTVILSSLVIQSWNCDVWPWNLAFMTLAYQLFWDTSSPADELGKGVADIEMDAKESIVKAALLPPSTAMQNAGMPSSRRLLLDILGRAAGCGPRRRPLLLLYAVLLGPLPALVRAGAEAEAF
jgi:hypothetical protein